MKNYSKWSKLCKDVDSYERAKEEVSKLSDKHINELMEVASFISSRTLYGIVSNAVAIIALILSPVGSTSIYYILGMVLLGIVIIIVIIGFFRNKAMVQGANYILWAIHDRKSTLEVEAS